ncbi:MAG TPA: hypothetical protein VIT41_02335 [Microlunatus sp.]
MTTGEQSTDGPVQLPRADKLIELIAVLMLGLTTLGTAWCAYQATQWSGESADLGRQSAQQTVENARLFGLATQTIAYDSMTVAQYAQAVSDGNTRLREFYRQSVIRPDFLPTLNRWEAEVRAGRAPVPLGQDPAYLATQLGPYEKSVAASAESARQSQAAGATASAYVSVTILLAVALFFAGVVSSFRYQAARALLLAASLAMLGLAASRLASLPVLF